VNPSQEEMLRQFTDWGKQQAPVRAMLLTSTRAIPNGPVDILSDYDLILVVTDVYPFFNSRDWLAAFGRVLALYRDPITPDGEFETVGYVVQFEDSLKIDFWVWPIGLLQRIVNEPKLTDELDAGYQVLLDKDNLAGSLKPPTYKAYIPTPPTETRYHEAIEMFFLDTAYVAKYLWRDDVMAAKHILDAMLKQEHMLPMLEWRAAIDHHWSIKPGPFGRRLKQWLRPDLWAELENTYTGADIDDNWEALFRTIALMRRLSIEVGEHLGYAYPHDIDERAVAYVQKIKTLGKS
jgi:aminoglycoside 6-adenylyltransferase